MQDNIKDLHSALISDGHYSEKELGNEQEFREYISKPENAKAFHQAIISDGYYNESELGNEDEFIKYVGTAGTAANAAGTVATDETGGIEQNTDAIQPHDPNAKPIVGTPEEPGMFSKMGDAVKRADQAFVDYISQAQKRRAEQEAMVAQRNAPAKLNENILSDEEEQRMLENAAATGQLNPTRSERQAAMPSVLMQKGENTTGKTPEERFETPVSKYAKESVFKMRGDEAARKRMEEQPFYTTSEYVDWLGTHPEGNKEQFEEELLRMGMRRTRMDVEDEAVQKFVDDTTVGEQLASIVTQTVDNAWRMRGVVGLSPQALSAEIGKQIQATPMTVAFMSKIYDEAQKLDIPFTDFLQKTKGAIIRSAQQKAMSQLEAKMMPKDDIEYMFEGIGESTVARFVRGMMFNPEYISMQERANQTYGAGVQQRWEDTVAENVGNETLRNVLTTTNPTELGRIGFEFAPEFLPMGFVGKVTGGVAKAVMEAKVARLVTLGMEPAAAARVVTLAAEGASTTSKMAQAATIGGANFAGYNVLSELARQFEAEDYDAKKLAKEGLKGLIIGGAIGSIGKGINVATQSSSAATRLAGMAGAFAVEDAVFTGAEEAEKWAEGRTDEINLVEDFTRGALTLGVMKVSSPGGLKESVAKVRRALNGEADPGAMLNEVEREQFKNSLSCKGLVAALNKATALSGPEFGEINKGTEVGTHGGGSYGIAGPMADEMRAEIAEAYRSVILDPTLDYSLKVKIGLAFEGSLPANVPRPTSFTTDDENMTVKTRDEHGFVIKTIKAKNKKDYETAKDRAVRSVIFSDALREGNLMGFEIIEQMVDGKEMDPKVIVKAIRAYIDGNATKEQNEIAGNFYERYMEVLRAMRTSEAGEAVDLMLEEKPIDVKAGTADEGTDAQMKTEADASGTVAKPAAEQQGTVAGSDGGAAVSGSTAPNLAAGAGVDGAGAQGGTGTGGQRTRGMMQRQRGEKIVADGDAMGAADLHTELVTAEARLGRVFADGSQNKAVADNAKKMADEGRTDQAYEYLLGEQGNMSETQRSAIEAYIDAQAAVMGMEQSVSEGIEAQVRDTEQRMMQMTNNQSGLLQSVMVTPMGTQKEPVKAYIKIGSLTNEYGPGSVQVVYVTVDEMGNEIPQQTVQIAKSRIVEGSASQPMSVDDYVDAYREQLTASINAQWKQNREGLSYKVGDKVYLTNGHDGVMEVVVDGVTADGEVVYHNAENPAETDSDNVQRFNEDVKAARKRLVGLQLTAEDSARIEEQKRQKMAAREAKWAAEIVGYGDSSGRNQSEGFGNFYQRDKSSGAGGSVDLTHENTRSQTAADYLVETEGGNEKAVAWIEAQKEQLATRINELLSQREDEAQWIGAYGGQDNPEETSHQTALEGIDNALTESSRQYQKLNEIKFYAMDSAMKKALAKTRGDEILDLQNSAKAGYKAPKERYKKGLPTDREGEVRLGVMEPQAAEKYLLDNCKTMMDADEALRQQFNRIDEEGRRLRSLVDNHRRRLQAYREGREDYDVNELKGIVDAEYRLQQEIQSLLVERTGVNNLDKKLEKIYAERNALDYQDDPTKLRVERIQRRKTAAAKLEQARREYANYPEAMVVLDAGLEPQTIEEYVSQVGSGVLNWEGRNVGEHHVRGLQEEIGRNMVRTHGVGKNRVVGDTRAFDYVLAPKGEGVGIDELAHKMAEDTQWEPDEIKEALINMLMSATKPDDIRNYTINNRLEEAETAARQQDDAEEAAAEEAAWRARNGMGEGGFEPNTGAAVPGAAAQGVAGDPFAAAGGAEGLYEGYDFMLSDNAEKENEHNERAKKEGGLISNAGSKGVDAGLCRLMDRTGRQIGRTIKVLGIDEMWNSLPESQKQKLGSKKRLASVGSSYYDNKNNQIVINGAWVNTFASPEDVIRVCLGHEMTHAIKTLNSAESWSNFVGYVKKAMGENAFNSELATVRKAYDGMPGYTGADKERKFEEEVCAFWIGDNKFSSDADIQKLVDAVDTDGVDMSAFMDTIRRILDMLNDLEEMAKEMKDAGLIDEYESGGLVDYKNKALGAWDEMYKRAAEKVEENRRRSVGNFRQRDKSSGEDGSSGSSRTGQGAAEAQLANEGVDFMLVTDPNEIKAFDDAPRRTQYRSMQLIDGKLYPPMATVVGKGKEKKRQDGLTIGDLFKADENPHLAKPIIDKVTGEQKVNPKTGRLQYSFSLDKGGKDDFGEELTSVDAAYNPYVHTSNSPINDQFATAYKRSNLVTVEGEISEDDINSGYWAEKAHDSVGEKDWKLGVTSTALEKAGKVARKVTLSQYFRPTRIVPTEEVAKYYAEQLKGTDITIPFNTVGPELREALVKLGVTISEPEKSNAGRASLPAYEAWKAASVKAPSGKAEGTVADGQIRDLVPSQKKDAQGNSFYERNGSIDLWGIDELLGKAGRQQAPVRLTDRNVKHILESHNKEFKGNAENVIDFIDDVFDGANILRKAKGRAMFVVVENTNNDKVAVIKMFPSEHGDYYNIDTIGYYRKNKWKKEEEIIGELSEPAPSESASNPSKPQAPDNSGKEPLNAKGQLSGGKVTNNSGNDQINQRKNAENQPKTADDDVQWALQPLEERVSGWALEDAQDLIADVRSVGGEVDDNGVVTVYHRTNSPEAVRSILSSGVMKTKEPAVFFSTHQKGSNNYGYGNWGVKLRIPAEKLQVDDVFTDELTLKMPLKGYKADVRQYLAEDNSDVQWALDVREHDPWLSNAAEGLNKIKQEKATGEQWVKMLQKNGGLKAEEDKWIGLSEWLTGSDGVETPANGGKVRTFTKAQVRQFIEENAVKIEDVEYSDVARVPMVVKRAWWDALEAENEDYGRAWRRFVEDDPTVTEEYDLNEEGDIVRKHEAGKINSTRKNYQTYGLKNNREIAMVVPGIEPYNRNDEVHFGDAGEGRAVAWVRFGDAENVVTEASTDEGALQALSNAKKAFDDYHKKLEEKYGTTELLELASKMSREDNAEWNRLDEEVTKADEAINKTKRNKVLVMDEVQSKRHQDGREKGYAGNTEERQKAWEEYNAIYEEIKEKYPQYRYDSYMINKIDPADRTRLEKAKKKVDAYKNGVPDAPFRKNWHEVGMKRMLRYAAENGYDKLAWTTGKQQAERYGLGGTVETIRSSHRNGHNNCLVTLDLNGGNKISFFVDKSTEIISETVSGGNADVFNGQRLSQVVGSEIAHKLLEGNAKLSGNDLSVGGEGMKGFYDQMLVKFMDKYCKKWGVKVQDVELDLPNSADRVMHSVDITPEMKDDVLDGQLMWALAGVKGAINIDKTSREDLKGEQSDVRTDNIFNLQRAIYLEETGYDAETVKYATGWERGVDGLWRLETNDLDIRFEPEGDEHTIMELAEGGDLKLGDIIKGDNGLFEAYPELADVIVDGNVHGHNRGRYVETTNVLSLNVDDLSNAYKSLAHVEKSLSRFDAADTEERKMILELADARNETSYKKVLESRKGNYENDLEFAKTELGIVLAHEVQHYIQDVEGFAQGGNPQMDAPEKLINERMKERKAELDELNARYEEAVRKTSEAEEVYLEALRKHGHYAYVQDENGDWKYNAEKASSPEGKALEAEYKRLYDVYDKLYDTELALLRKLDAVKDDMRPLGMDGYRRLAGEVEARTVGRRSQLNDRERRESVARSMGNMDIPEALQIVVRGEKHEANSAGEPLNTKKAAAPGAAVQNRGTVAEMLDWMLGERRMNAGTTTQANKESWERAKGAYPEKVIVMDDGAGRFVTFRDDARTIGEAIGKKPEDGVLRLNYGEYMTAQTKLGDVVDDAHWSGFESFDDAEGSVWADGKVRGRDAKEFVRTWPEYKRLRGRISEAVKQGDKGVLEAACDDYREALNEMLDNSREDINVLKGAHKVLVEQLSEVNDVQAGVASGFAVDSAAPGAAARNKAAGTKADASGTVAGGVKSQKEWQKMAPTDYELWESADMGERDAIGEYYDGDWQALCHAVKRGETGAIEEAARRMAVIFNTYPDEENRSTKKNDSGHPQQLLVLVPVPGHTGKATYTLRLVKELSKLTGIPYADILETEPHKSGYAAKLDGEDAEIVIRAKEGTKAPEAGGNYAARIPVLIDNVTASGKTLNACAEALDSDARKALGLDEVNLHSLVLAEDNSISLPIGEKTVSLQAQEASRVRWQARELPEHKPEQPWKDVKKVAVHTSNMRKRLPQMYYAAKHGDVKAAHELVSEVMKPHVIVSLAVEHPDAMVVYPHYESADGANAIPAAYAGVFENYGLTVDTDIVQKNRVYRTDATRYDRLMNRARFAGNVIPGQEYILVDDHITSGATLRDMKDYIESEDGVVVAWSALEGSAGSTNVELTEENKNKLKELGVTDEQVRKLGISRSIDNLTNAEARELATLAKRGRDFRSKEQKAERARTIARTEAQGRRRRADQRAAEAESRRLREAAEAEKRYEDLRRERERFVRLFGEMPAETPLGTRGGAEVDASGTFANGTKVVAKPAAEQQGTVAAEWESMIKAARDAVNANPTDGQKEAGNYKKGHLRLDGFNISLENAKGSTRSGKDADGKAWSVTMNYDYGDIRGRVGVDGDNIDVYLSDKPYEGNVYVVDQVDPKTGAFDEHKVMYGFNSLEEAKEAYLSNYEDGWKGLGNITEVGKAEFKEWLQSSKRKVKPFAEYKRFRGETAASGSTALNNTAAPGAAARNRGDKPRVFEVEVTDEDKVEMRIIEEEMEEILDEQASNVIEYFKTRDIEEQFGRFPGDKMSLRDRGIVLTPYQRKLFGQILDEYYEWELRNIVVRNRKGEIVSRPTAAPTTPWNRWGWWPEELPKEADYEENPWDADAKKVDLSGRERQATTEKPLHMLENETVEEAEARWKRERARERVKAKLEGTPMSEGGTAAAQNGAGSDGDSAGRGAKVDKYGQLSLWDDEGRDASGRVSEDVLWALGVDPARPRKKKGESEFEHKKRLKAWEKMQEYRSSLPPAPDKEAIDQRWTEQFENDHAAWAQRHGLGNLMDEEPDRPDYNSVDEYIEALKTWEKQETASADVNDPEPQALDYMKKAQEEYRKAYAKWEEESNIHGTDPGTYGAQAALMSQFSPAAQKRAIDEKWHEQYKRDLAAWEERHGLEWWMAARPDRKNYGSVDEYAEALKAWEKQVEAQNDTQDPKPKETDYMVKAREEYNNALTQFKKDNNVKEEGEGTLDFSTVFTGEGAQPRTVVGTNVETGEQVEMPADEVLAERIAEDEEVMKETGANIGFANTPAGARRAVKIAVIERRKTLESSGAEDAIFLHELKTDMKKVAKELGMKGEELDKMLPFIIEAPTRLAEIVRDTYFDMSKRDLDFYTVKYLLPKIFSNEATDEALINDLRDVMRQAVEAGEDEGLTAAMKHYAYYNDERVKPILDKVARWYQEFYVLLDSKGLRRDAGKVKDYVNHIWDKERSDAKAYDTYVRTTSSNMRMREIETYAKGIEAGLVPKREKLSEIMAHYSRENNEAIANKELLNYLTGLKVALYNSDGELVDSLDLLSSEDPGINKKKYMRYEVPGVGGVWVLKDVQKRFATIFGQEWNLDANEGENKLWRSYDRVADTMKKIQLSLSFFHLGALTEVATVQKNPFMAMADLFKYTFWDSLRAGTTPALAHPEDFKDAAAHLVKLGASDDYAAAEVQALTGKLRELAQEVYDHQKAVGAVPLAASALLDWINKGMDKLLWEYVHDGLKVAIFRGYAKNIRAKAAKEGWSDRKLDMMLDEAGQYINDAFGGQYWEVIGVTPASLRTLRRALLSPDWFISTVRHALAATGFGSLYSPEDFISYATMRGKWDKEYKEEYEEAMRAEGDEGIGNEGRKFRAKKSLLCYGLLVPLFYGGMMNVINAAFRYADEQREKEKADEIRKTNPDYLSPYEIIYPDGMKWYDYTMWGNSVGNRTLLFTGRYKDGTERYARWGKQFREMPEFFTGRYGVEVPGPFLERMMGKSNPLVGTALDLLRYFGAGLLNKTPEQQDLEQEYGKHLGALAMVAKKFLPFSVPTDESKEFYWLDLVMPSKKGFSDWRAVDAYEHFILAGDLDGVGAVTNACIMNGIDAEQKLQAAIKHIEATQRKERTSGIEDIESAMKAFDASGNVKDRRALKRKIAAFMTRENYKLFKAVDAQQRVADYLNGSDEAGTGVTRKQSEQYVLLMTAEDARDEIIITKAYGAANDVKKKAKVMAQNGNTSFAQQHAKEISTAKVVSSYRSAMNKLKKNLGKGNDEAVMADIRAKRKELIEKIDRLGE